MRINTRYRNPGLTRCRAGRTIGFPLLLFLSALLTPGILRAQPVTVSWALTADNSAVVSGNLTATPHAFSGGLTSTTYNGTNGATAANFGGVVCTPNPDDFFEFTLTPDCGNDLEITSIDFEHRTSSPPRCFQLWYSVNGQAELQLGGNIDVLSTTPTAYSSGAISLAVPQGQTVVLRLYGATGNNFRSLSCRNFTVSGTSVPVATPAAGISITADPDDPICPGTLVSFVALAENGGTAPSYQWKINGINAGTDSPFFAHSFWSDGDQVTCDITSNMMCVSPATATSNAIPIIFLPTVIATPGPVTGPDPVPVHAPGLVYEIAAVPDALTYSWLVPPGWAINSGSGTPVITVTSGGAGQGGPISVTASNQCATSTPSSLNVSMIMPHAGCNECHITHSSPGLQITNVAGNGNLCMSCHNPNGTAAYSPFSNAMKAIPGISGNSHSWDAAAVNALYESDLPSDPALLARLPDGKIICSTCHNQHNPYVFPYYLRASNASDALCKDCHSARNVGTYAGDPDNKGSHPVGTDFDPSDPRFLAAPLAPYRYPEGKVECSSCHQTHYAASTDGHLLRSENGDAVCTSCHIGLNRTMMLNHEGFSCKTCHFTHSPDKSNILMVRNSLETPNNGLQPVAFTGNLGPGDYADGSAPYNGICEVCHTSTDHYNNTGTGISDPRHNPSTQRCVDCHPHNQGFYAVSNCFDCHNDVTDKPGVGPPGGRRQIVDNAGNGMTTGGDFKRYSHHVAGPIPDIGDCLKCHYMGDHMNGEVKLLHPDLGFLGVLTFDPQNVSGIEGFCTGCHDADGAAGDLTPFSDNLPVPVIDYALWNASSHKGAMTCMTCHDNGHGSNKGRLLGPYNYSGPGTGTDLTNEEEGFCLSCHGGSGSATGKVHLAFSSYSNTSTDIFKHDPAATYRIHTAGENGGTYFGGANRHVECVDCHNPHAVISGTATAPVLLPALTGATGVEPIYSGAGAPAGFTWQPAVTAEYQVCFKCHSSFTTLPAYLPGGWDGSAFLPDGLRKLTTGGQNGQVADNRDMAAEFNPNHFSFHPVIAQGNNPGINPSTFRGSWSATSMMYCTDCHNNPQSATPGQGKGPHASQNLHLLDQLTPGNPAADYKTYHNNDVQASSGDVCGKCHQTTYWNSGTGSRFLAHGTHMNGASSECYVCHDSHGSEQYHLLNFNRNMTDCITTMTGTSQSAFNHAVGAANSCTLTCHGATHTGASRTYTPAYP